MEEERRGVKRGTAALEDAAPVQFFLVENYFPDDVVAELFLAAYRRELMSCDEMDELLRLKLVSRQFRRVIERDVIPRIRFLCGEILKAITLADLGQFWGLEAYSADTVNLIHLDSHDVVSFLPQLRDLRLSGASTSGGRRLDMPPITKLHCESYALNKSDLDGARESLLQLTLAACPLRSPLRKYRPVNLLALRLRNQRGYTDEDLVRFTTLRELRLINGEAKKIHDETFGALTELRVLELRHAKRLSDACLAPLLQLEELAVMNNTDISLQAIARLQMLVALSVDASVALDIDLLLGMPNLRALSLTEGDLRSADIARLTDLTRLDLTATKLYTRHLVMLTNLVSFMCHGVRVTLTDRVKRRNGDVVEEERQGDFSALRLRHLKLNGRGKYSIGAILSDMSTLEVLDVSHNIHVNNTQLSALPALRALFIENTPMITMSALDDKEALEFVSCERSRLTDSNVAALRARGVICYTEYSIESMDEVAPRYLLPFLSGLDR